MQHTAAGQIAHSGYARLVLFVVDVNHAARFFTDTRRFEKSWHEYNGAGTVCQVNRGEREIILCEDAKRSG